MSTLLVYCYGLGVKRPLDESATENGLRSGVSLDLPVMMGKATAASNGPKIYRVHNCASTPHWTVEQVQLIILQLALT